MFVVVCGEPRAEDDTFDTLLNPVVIIEALSPSTEAYDRGEKFEHYQHIASLKDYLLISQDEVRIEHYCRQGSEWLRSEFRELADVLSLPAIDCKLRLQDVYRPR